MGWAHTQAWSCQALRTGVNQEDRAPATARKASQQTLEAKAAAVSTHHHTAFPL